MISWGRRGRGARVALAFTCLSVAALLTGCGAKGTAVAGEIDVRTLDTGSYPVGYFTYDRHNSGNGATLEGMRMADAVVSPAKIDSSLNIGRGGRVLPTVDDVLDVSHLASAVRPVLKNRGYLTGFAASGADCADVDGQLPASATGITIRVLRFPSADNAKLAARELEDADFAVATDQNRKLTVPGYPDAYSHWRPGVPNIGLSMAHKDFVISLFGSRPTADQNDLLSWMKKTLDAEIPALDAFVPTPADRIADLPLDPDRLLARTLVPDRDHTVPDEDKFATFPANWLILDADDVGKWTTMVHDTGLDYITFADTNYVFRVRDEQAGTDLVTRMIDEIGESPSSVVPDKVPNVECVHRTSSGSPNRCYVVYKRYVGIVNATSESDVQQKAAAQYALLANSL